MSVTVNGTSGLVFGDGTIQGTAAGMAFRNKIINGDMRIDQRNAGTSVSFPTNTAQIYVADRWWGQRVGDSQTMTVQQVTDAPAGYSNSLKYTTGTAGTATASSSTFISQRIEGYNVSDLAWGTSAAKTVTLSFWVKASIAGTYSGSFCNSGSSRTYAFPYTINSTNTWEYKIVTVAGDTSGTWLKDNSWGIGVIFDLGCGPTIRSTGNAWVGVSTFGITGTVSPNATAGATWQVTGVQFEKAAAATDFERRSHGTELAMCQRYYQKTYQQDGVPGTTNTSTNGAIFTSNPASNTYPNIGTWNFAVPMRAFPSVLGYNPLTGVTGNFRGDAANYTNLAITAIGDRSASFFGNNISVGTSVFMSIHATAISEL